jgi:predicted naringenin-chalcone synthase
MADWMHTLSDWSARGAGALAGSSISLVYLLPTRRREAVSRFIVGIVSGMIFGPAVGEMLMVNFGLAAPFDRFEVMLMGASAASFASWWVLGLIVRALGRRDDAANRLPANGAEDAQ